MRGSAAVRTGVVPGGVLAGPWVKNELWRRARAVPSLDLRFADNKSLTDAVTGQNLITFTRASSGTFVNSEGLIQTATTDVPRFDHNPTTGESLGLLVEESRTNLLLQSNQFDTTWTNTNSSETAAAGTAPDGTNTAWELKDTADAVATVHSLVQTTSFSFTSGVAYTFSCWMKAGTLIEGGLVFPTAAFTSAINCRINLSTGAVISSSPTVSASTVSYANGWYRVIATATATATSAGAVNIRPANGALSYIGTGTGTILIWGAQIEAGSFPTSYIPTTSATVTRSADVASITGTNFSSWYRQDEGTLYAEGAVPVGATGSRALASLDDATNNERIQIGHNGTTGIRNLIVDGGTTQFLPGVVANSFPPGEYRKLALAARVNDFAAISTPGTVVTGSSGTMPTPTQLQIGIGAGQASVNSPIKRVTYWPTRLVDSTIQAVTQ